jgi:hypothetical protein
VAGTGKGVLFSHNGRDEGFDAMLVAEAEGGHGLAVMINANDNSRMMARIRRYVSTVWGQGEGTPVWPTPAATAGVAVSRELLARYAGYYEAAENQMIVFAPDAKGTGLQTISDGLTDEWLPAIDSASFGSSERPFWLQFAPGPAGGIDGVGLRRGTGAERKAPRIVPLPASLEPAPDPDPATTARIAAVVRLLISDPVALKDSPDLTPGTKQFLGWKNPALAGAESLTYLGEERVEGRGIKRNGGEVARVRMFRFNGTGGVRYLLIHTTGDGKLTDYDVVAR